MFFSVALLGRYAKRIGFTQLTTKRAKKGYYKGKGAIPTGQHTKAGNYIVTWDRAPNYIAPDLAHLASFALKPYVAKNVPKSLKAMQKVASMNSKASPAAK
eukprot:CAMPEP_0197617572 /NCGR_PEP_ID=MMETSP1326-20131121/61101_1 /TAXON_ID=1155430 /ORGANISM="Genus nov. species nov., Strain RCC2288" /LENGTH=100 /DNA_ID=CAMNT_0043186467 /DNA_START=438 /DNA_END=740 /DNA_ORIENTATION=-